MQVYDMILLLISNIIILLARNKLQNFRIFNVKLQL